MSPRVVLVGPPGAGKTTVGRLLAERLGTTFRDTDADIVTTAGKSIAEIFIADGEPRFRSLEQDAVAAALREHDGVLSLGGGAVLSHKTRQLLTQHLVVLLDVDLRHAAQRVGLNRERPVLAMNPRAQLRVLLDERMPLYREVAELAIDTNEATPDEVVAFISQQLPPMHDEDRARARR